MTSRFPTRATRSRCAAHPSSSSSRRPSGTRSATSSGRQSTGTLPPSDPPQVPYEPDARAVAQARDAGPRDLRGVGARDRRLRAGDRPRGAGDPRAALKRARRDRALLAVGSSLAGPVDHAHRVDGRPGLRDDRRLRPRTPPRLLAPRVRGRRAGARLAQLAAAHRRRADPPPLARPGDRVEDRAQPLHRVLRRLLQHVSRHPLRRPGAREGGAGDGRHARRPRALRRAALGLQLDLRGAPHERLVRAHRCRRRGVRRRVLWIGVPPLDRRRAPRHKARVPDPADPHGLRRNIGRDRQASRRAAAPLAAASGTRRIGGSTGMRGCLVALVVSSVVITACASAPAASPTPSVAGTQAASATPAAPKDKVTLTGINSTELNLPTLVAIAKDFFGSENIELGEFVIGSSGTLRQAMIAKQYEFGLYAFVHIPIARLAGSPFKAVIELHDQEFFGLIVRSQLKDQVKTVKDLKGRKIGYTTPGSGSWALGNVYLKKAGLDPDRDVELVSLGGDNAVFYTALQSGRVDAIVSFEPIAQKVLADNVGVFLLDPYQPGQAKEWTGSDKAAALFLVTREDVIQAKPDLVKRMAHVQKKGLDFIRANTASAIADAILASPKAAEQIGRAHV